MCVPKYKYDIDVNITLIKLKFHYSDNNFNSTNYVSTIPSRELILEIIHL